MYTIPATKPDSLRAVAFVQPQEASGGLFFHVAAPDSPSPPKPWRVK